MSTYVIPRDPEKLRAAIDESGFSAAEIASAANVTRQFVSRLVTGRRLRILAANAHAIESKLAAPIGSLFRVDDAVDVSPYHRDGDAA